MQKHNVLHRDRAKWERGRKKNYLWGYAGDRDTHRKLGECRAWWHQESGVFHSRINHKTQIKRRWVAATGGGYTVVLDERREVEKRPWKFYWWGYAGDRDTHRKLGKCRARWHQESGVFHSRINHKTQIKRRWQRGGYSVVLDDRHDLSLSCRNITFSIETDTILQHSLLSLT